MYFHVVYGGGRRRYGGAGRNSPMTDMYWASGRAIGPYGKRHLAQIVLFLNFLILFY